MRYSQLTPILRRFRPKAILEVGTWNGDRAIQMVLASGAEIYYGFDLFEQATADTDAAEFNVKPHFSKAQVSSKLKEAMIRHELHAGNTNVTLPAFVETKGKGWLDFAYIDGGHSVATIQSDWDCVRELMSPGGVVVFDDYYTNAGPEFLNQYGANLIVERLDYRLLPATDRVVNGACVQMAMVELPAA